MENNSNEKENFKKFVENLRDFRSLFNIDDEDSKIEKLISGEEYCCGWFETNGLTKYESSKLMEALLDHFEFKKFHFESRYVKIDYVYVYVCPCCPMMTRIKFSIGMKEYIFTIYYYQGKEREMKKWCGDHVTIDMVKNIEYSKYTLELIK